jgi:hypothetical protein
MQYNTIIPNSSRSLLSLFIHVIIIIQIMQIIGFVYYYIIEWRYKTMSSAFSKYYRIPTDCQSNFRSSVFIGYQLRLNSHIIYNLLHN